MEEKTSRSLAETNRRRTSLVNNEIVERVMLQDGERRKQVGH